jgi:hypothetical protein
MDGTPTSRAESLETLHADLARDRAGFQRLTLSIFRIGQHVEASRSPLARILRPLYAVGGTSVARVPARVVGGR